MSKEELKACPFCGGEDCDVDSYNTSKWTVLCNGCGVETDGEETEGEAIKAWSTRAESQELEREKAELVEWLESKRYSSGASAHIKYQKIINHIKDGEG